MGGLFHGYFTPMSGVYWGPPKTQKKRGFGDMNLAIPLEAQFSR